MIHFSSEIELSKSNFSMNKFYSRHFSNELVRIGFSFEKDQPCQLMGRKHEVNNLDLWLSLLGCAQRAFEDGYYCFCGDSSGNRHQLKLCRCNYILYFRYSYVSISQFHIRKLQLFKYLAVSLPFVIISKPNSFVA